MQIATACKGTVGVLVHRFSNINELTDEFLIVILAAQNA